MVHVADWISRTTFLLDGLGWGAELSFDRLSCESSFIIQYKEQGLCKFNDDQRHRSDGIKHFGAIRILLPALRCEVYF